MKQPAWSAWAVGIVFCTQVLALGLYYPKWKLTGTEALISWDVAGYYMYLPAAFVYHDLGGDSYHELVTKTYKPSPQFDHAFLHPSGAYVMKYSLGMALQYAPFFAVAQAFAKTQSTYPADGFSLPYQLAITAEILFFALLSLLLLRRLLRHYFQDGVVAWTILAVGLATNYLEYSSLGGGLTHLNLFVLYCVLVLATRRFHAKPSLGMAAVIGATIGLATLTRPTELLMLLVPILWGIELTLAGLRARVEWLWQQRTLMLVAAACGAAFMVLQPMYWRLIAGEWIVYSYQDQGFNFLKPKIWRGFTSFGGGWLPYTPLGLLMLAGFWPLRRQHAQVWQGLLVYVLVFMYVAWSWEQWQYGGSLGQRTMVQVYPLLAMPLAALFTWTVSGGGFWRKLVIGVGFGVSLMINLFWTHQAHRGGMFMAGEMTWRYYFAQLGRFDKPRERLILLDRARLPPTQFDSLAASAIEGFEAEGSKDTLICGEAPLAGSRSLCIRQGADYGARYALPLAPAEADWAKLSFDIDVREKTWDTWGMMQIILRFRKGDKVVAAYFRRPERLLDQGRTRMTLDTPLPKSGSYNKVEWQIWKPGLGGNVVIDEVQVVWGRCP